MTDTSGLSSHQQGTSNRRRKRPRGWDLDNSTADLGVASPSSSEDLLLKQLQQIEILQQSQQNASTSLLALAPTALTSQQEQPSRRIYVGSIHYDLKESDVVTLFSTFGTVTRSEMSMDSMTGRSKGFCFLEFAEPASAEAAMAMDGFELAGRKIKVGRPHHQQGMSTALNPLTSALLNPLAANLGSSLLSGGFNSTGGSLCVVESTSAPQQLDSIPTTLVNVDHLKFDTIVVRRVSANVGEQELRTIFEAFGKVTACSAEAKPNNVNELFTYFVRFDADGSVVQRTADSMTGFELAGQRLKCTACAWENREVCDDILPTDSLTSVMLRNMVTIRDIDDPELKDEIAEEAQNYGTLRDVEFDVAGEDVRVLLRYKNSEDAERAVKAMNGRIFAGNKIDAELTDLNT